ncbi:MAG: hypothetical protein GKR88_05125 [Flavobacteriaceae bacterium]|nr:MAG: hypothetical protein GKR88_05125 [Flavobacteriaceae bacterium]
MNSFKLFGCKRKLEVFNSVESFFELHSSATEGEKFFMSKKINYKILICSLILFVFMTNPVCSQNLPSIVNEGNYLKSDQLKSNYEETIEGSIYLTKEFKPLMVTVNREKITYPEAIYDIKNSGFIVKKQNGSLAVIDDTKITEILFEGQRFKKIDGIYYVMLFEV